MIGPDDLADLMAAAGRSMPASAMQHLIAMGADGGFAGDLLGAGLLGLAQVSVSGDGARWEPEGPDRRLLIGVTDEFGELADVVAISSARRDEWALLTGMGWALGLDRFEAAATRIAVHGERVRLRLLATPLDWLAAGGEGLCVLDWRADALRQIRLPGEKLTLVAADPAAAARLKQLLQWGGLPRVETAGATSAAEMMGLVA